MKKITKLTVTMLLLFVLTACNKDVKPEADDAAKQSDDVITGDEVTPDGDNAAKNDEILFNDNGVEDTEMPSDSSSDETVSSTEEADNKEENSVSKTWEKHYYVDEFDEPTDEWYISSMFFGKFSNSATNNSPLAGYILIDESDVSFILYEYNRSQVKNGYSHDESYTISVRTEVGDQAEYRGSIWSGGDRIIVSDADKDKVLELLKNGEKIKFYIYETDNSVTNYLFTVESNNLNDLLQ